MIPGLFPQRPVLTVSWTLSFVFAGYILLPAMAQLCRRAFGSKLNLAWVWLGATIAVILCAVLGDLVSIRLSYIPMGALLAEVIMVQGVVLKQRHQMIFAAVSAAVLLLFRYAIQNWHLVPSDPKFLYSLCGLAAGSILVLLLFSCESILRRRFLSWPSRLLRSVGVRGYSFYLLHGAVTKVAVFGLASMWSWQQWPMWLCVGALAGCFVLTLMAASASCTLLEKEATNLVLAFLRHRGREVSYPLVANCR